jgi:hypothetical protein
LKVFTKASTTPLLSGLSIEVKQDSKLKAKAISIVRWAAKIAPLLESHCT